ncbi:MAG TPA: hypothetical protein V6D11_04700 [Waterburya sp.]|jgi:hypothetical protein
MPLQLPNLDDRTYNDLVEEALRLIPSYAPEWTNHNPSDPGITLIELFAYLTEILNYRLNRVTDENLCAFLKLLNGPEWPGSGKQCQDLDLRQEVQLAVLGVRERYRAITCEDFERLSIENFNRWLAVMQQKEHKGEPLDEWWQVTGLNSTSTDNLPSKVTGIQRSHCVARRYLDAGTEAARREPKPGHISTIILPVEDKVEPNELGPQPTPVQRQAIWGYLEQRRLLTTRHHVVGPFYAPVNVEILLARRSDVPPGTVRDRITDAITNFLRPLPPKEQPEQTVWPFGRDVYVSELYEVLEKLEGVDFIPDIMLFSECKPEDKHCVAAEPIWHEEGDLIGLRLFEHHLPAARLDPNRIVIEPSGAFVTVQIAIAVTATSSTEPKILKQQLKKKMREFFHPLYPGPGSKTSDNRTISQQQLKQAVEDVAGVQPGASIKLQNDPNKLSVQIKAGELVDLRLQVEVKKV